MNEKQLISIKKRLGENHPKLIQSLEKDLKANTKIAMIYSADNTQLRLTNNLQKNSYLVVTFNSFNDQVYRNETHKRNTDFDIVTYMSLPVFCFELIMSHPFALQAAMGYPIWNDQDSTRKFAGHLNSLSPYFIVQHFEGYLMSMQSGLNKKRELISKLKKEDYENNIKKIGALVSKSYVLIQQLNAAKKAFNLAFEYKNIEYNSRMNTLSNYPDLSNSSKEIKNLYLLSQEQVKALREYRFNFLRYDEKEREEVINDCLTKIVLCTKETSDFYQNYAMPKLEDIRTFNFIIKNYILNMASRAQLQKETTELIIGE